MRPPKSPSRYLPVVRALFFITAAIWLLIGAFSLVRMAQRGSLDPLAGWVIGRLIFANAAAMLAAGIGLASRTPLVYLFATAWVVLNSVLTITDQFGLWDLITLAIDLILLALLLTVRSMFFPIKG